MKPEILEHATHDVLRKEIKRLEAALNAALDTVAEQALIVATFEKGYTALRDKVVEMTAKPKEIQ